MEAKLQMCHHECWKSLKNVNLHGQVKYSRESWIYCNGRQKRCLDGVRCFKKAICTCQGKKLTSVYISFTLRQGLFLIIFLFLKVYTYSVLWSCVWWPTLSTRSVSCHWVTTVSMLLTTASLSAPVSFSLSACPRSDSSSHFSLVRLCSIA